MIRPISLTAYRLVQDEIFFEKQPKFDSEKLISNEDLSTYVNVSITLDPPIQLPAENPESYRTGNEDSNLLIKANEWRLKL